MTGSGIRRGPSMVGSGKRGWDLELLALRIRVLGLGLGFRPSGLRAQGLGDTEFKHRPLNCFLIDPGLGVSVQSLACRLTGLG